MGADTIPKLFLEKVQTYGSDVALREKELGVWRPITWNEYYDHVVSFSLGCRDLGLKHRDKVSILGDNCPEWLYADIATQSLRGVAVGVYPTNTAEQVKYVLENSGSKFVVVRDQEQLDKVLEVKANLPLLKRIIVIDMKGIRKYTDPLIVGYEDVEAIGRKIGQENPRLFCDIVSETEPADIAIIVYTSGTTGPPKGAMLSHRNITAVQQSFLQVLPITKKDSLVSALPLCHVAERMFSLFLPMKVGCTINFAESVVTMQADMIEISPTIFLTVPRILEKMHSTITIKIQDANPIKRWAYHLCLPIGKKIADIKLSGGRTGPLHRALFMIAYFVLFRPLRNRIGLLQVRECVSGAAPLSRDIIRFFLSLGIRIKEAYGCTESTGIISMPVGEGLKLGSVGKPVPGIDFRLAEDGEVLIKGGLVFEGYHNDPEGSKRVLKEGWLCTGDIGKLDGEGDLFIVDRKKEIIINAAGKNIAPSEIENRLKFSPFISEAVLIGEGRRYLTALIQVDYENVANWAQKKDVPFTNYKSLVGNPRVRELIDREVKEVNRHLARVEAVKKFALLDKELDQDDGEVTATMKVKRQIIEEKYRTIIEAMY